MGVSTSNYQGKMVEKTTKSKEKAINSLGRLKLLAECNKTQTNKQKTHWSWPLQAWFGTNNKNCKIAQTKMQSCETICKVAQTTSKVAQTTSKVTY